MPVTVVVKSGSTDASRPPSVTLDLPVLVLGRGESCDVRLPDASVSLRHATVRQRGADHIVQDEGSTNGTMLGGVKLAPRAPRLVRNGDLVRLGRVWIEIRFDTPTPSASPALATKELALGLVARALEAQGESGFASVEVVEGPEAGRKLELGEAGRAYVVGRGRDVDLPLDDADASRKHLEIALRGDAVWLRDLASKNGTKLDDEPLPPEREVAWRRGAHVRVGAHVLALSFPALDALAELERAGDELLRGDPGAPPESPNDRPPSVASPAPDEQPAAPVVGVPRAERRPAGASGSVWSKTDTLVVLLAAGVIALSGLGLWLLLRG